MTKHSKDYITTYADYAAQRAEMEAYAASHPDMRKTYVATYEVNGHKFSERIIARDESDATEQLKQSCSMTGWIPRNIEFKEEK